MGSMSGALSLQACNVFVVLVYVCLFVVVVVVPCLLSIALRYKVCAVVTTPFLWIYVVQADGGMSYSCMARL